MGVVPGVGVLNGKVKIKGTRAGEKKSDSKQQLLPDSF